MVKPEVTLGLLRSYYKRAWGAKAMERRVLRCCDQNPDCIYENECSALYDSFVNVTEDKRKEIYHQLRELDVGSVEARANLSAKRVKELRDG